MSINTACLVGYMYALKEVDWLSAWGDKKYKVIWSKPRTIWTKAGCLGKSNLGTLHKKSSFLPVALC